MGNDAAMVSVENIDWLEKKVAHINRKNAKHGLPPIELHYGEIVEVVTKVTDDNGDTIEVPVAKRQVTLVGEPPVLKGWKVLGTLYHAGEAGNVVNSLPDQKVPEEYRFASPDCNHCDWKRNRKDTFILQNEETGEVKQVGRTCLGDFTAAKNVKAMIHAVDWLVQAKNAVKEATGMGAWDGYQVTVRRYLAAAVQAVMDHGWTPKKRNGACTSDPTYMRACRYFHNAEYGVPEYHITDEAFEKADEIVSWAWDDLRTADTLNDYLHNVMSVILTDVIDFRRGGALLASAPAAFDRKDEKPAGADSNWLGKVGGKVKATVEVTWVKQMQSHYGNGFCYLYKFKDENDNRLCWFASRDQDIDVGDVVEIKGSVKKHNTYKGVNETQMTRCSISR